MSVVTCLNPATDSSDCIESTATPSDPRHPKKTLEKATQHTGSVEEGEISGMLP